MRFSLAAVRLLILLWLTTSVAQGEDWPEFRGATGQGITTAKNLPLEWNREKNVVWRTQLEGEGWSSPVVVAGRVYLSAAVEKKIGEGDAAATGFSLRALCFDAASGSLVWSHEVFEEGPDAPKIHNKNSHASPTPLVVGERVFFHFAHQGTACLDREGNVVWQNRELAYAPVHGGGCSPILVDGLLVFSADGREDPAVIALDAATGTLKWKYARPNNPPKKFAFCTPLAIEVEGQKQIISPGAGSVSALDPRDGAEIWRVDYADGYSIVPRPVFAHGLVFVSSGYDSPEVHAIRPDGRGNVTDTHVAWRLKKGAPNSPSMLVVGDELYFVSDGGVASCVDARTGESHWVQRLGGGFSSSPLLAEGRIYFVNEAGEGTVIAPGKTFTKLGQNGFGERTLASYAVADESLFIRTEKALYRVAQRD